MIIHILAEHYYLRLPLEKINRQGNIHLITYIFIKYLARVVTSEERLGVGVRDSDSVSYKFEIFFSLSVPIIKEKIA